MCDVAPGYAGALALEALARLALGDAEGADRLLDHDRLIVARSLSPPDGFADLAQFNSALAAHAATHPTLLPSPPSHATAGGCTPPLLIEPRGPVAALERALWTAIAAYRSALPDLPEHPFIANQPRAASMNMWGVVLQRGGHQIPHIHAEAWLSGVYYPQIPAAVSGGDGPAGWLEFGDADRAFPRHREPRVVRLRPVEGLLVLFPSYFYHRTIPFEADLYRASALRSIWCRSKS